MKNIAIFASGSGSNAERFFEYFEKSKEAKIALVLSNKADAFVLERAKKYNIPSVVFNRTEIYEAPTVANYLKEFKIDFIVLAGFMWLFPSDLVAAYGGNIVNIHPALLPKYGGKGMYGHHVHEAVVNAGEKESGITIHYVNSKYDEGDIIFQARCALTAEDGPDEVAKKIHRLEHTHYPVVVESLIRK